MMKSKPTGPEAQVKVSQTDEHEKAVVLEGD